MQIPGQLFVPRDLKSGEKRPAVMFFHGGSRRQMLLAWHYLSYYHNTYAMNQYPRQPRLHRAVGELPQRHRLRTELPRGARLRRDRSQRIQRRDGRRLYMKQRPDVDPQRIGVYGGSYGGYLTAHALARASDLFAAGVDIHGVHDWNVGIRTFVPTYDPSPRSSGATSTSRRSHFVQGLALAGAAGARRRRPQRVVRRNGDACGSAAQAGRDVRAAGAARRNSRLPHATTAGCRSSARQQIFSIGI